MLKKSAFYSIIIRSFLTEDPGQTVQLLEKQSGQGLH